jgi:hypothetical protein
MCVSTPLSIPPPKSSSTLLDPVEILSLSLEMILVALLKKFCFKLNPLFCIFDNAALQSSSQ